MTRLEMMHDLALDGDYTPYHDLTDEYNQMYDLIEQIKAHKDFDDVDELGDLSATAEALHDIIEEIVGWKLEMGE